MINILVIVSVMAFMLYGSHRLFLLYLWYQYNTQPISHKHTIKEYPYVTVQLPVYNECYVIKRLIETASKMDYPRDRFEIQVLDDSTDETTEIIGNIIRELEGIDIKHIHRKDRYGFKAGALQEGQKIAKGDFIAVFDSDFIPPKDFLKDLMPYFEDERVGMVQARWEFLNENLSFLTKAQALSLRSHFRIEHLARNRSGRFFNFNGTAGIWRKKTIVDAGGWHCDTLTEDLDLSYRAQMEGWKFLYIDDVSCPSELPPTMKAFKSQQYRWMKGMAEVARKILPRVIHAKLPLFVKIEACAHLLAPLTYGFSLVTFLLLLPLITMSGGTVPLWIGTLYAIGLGWTTMIMGVFHYITFRNDKYSLLDYLTRFIFLLMIGIGNSLNAVRATVEGYLNIQSPFVRTPKYGVGTIAKNAKYRIKQDTLIFFEAFMCIYAGVLLIASIRFCLPVVPWAALFLTGWLVVVLSQINETIYDKN